MSDIEVSILIVYMNDKRMVRQTLRNIARIAPRCTTEILCIDNNVADGIYELLHKEFPEVRYIPMDKNRGFGAGMNAGARVARGKYLLVFNPDLAPEMGSVDCLLMHLQKNPSIGLIAPLLQNPDTTLQYSCCRNPTLLIPLLRRTPLGKTAWGKKHIAQFQMHHVSHETERDVDWVLGSAMLLAKDFFTELDGFDEQFFMYYEDADLCRRVWASGKRVVYFPNSRMIHYHRRASADGSFFRQLLNPLVWQHIKSACLYAKKHRTSPPSPCS